MADVEAEGVSRKQKLDAILAVVRYDPKFVGFIVLLGIVVAILEGIGLTFIIPVIELVQTSDPGSGSTSRVMEVFITVYQIIGIPLTLETAIGGVALIMTCRYTGSFIYSWLRRILQYRYMSHTQRAAFNSALDARIEYFDKEGSDDILNTILTESKNASKAIDKMVRLLSLLFLTTVYLILLLWVSPLLTLVIVPILGGMSFVLRNLISPGYEIGDRVADANESKQQAAQAAMIGIRDIRIFNLSDEVHQKFADAVDIYTKSRVKLRRNEAAISQFYNLTVAVSVFVLIYLALRFANLSFGELGLFLFAMFQLGPKVSGLNERVYAIENGLPHLVRTHRFINKLKDRKEPSGGTQPAPDTVNSVEFDDVHFSYSEEGESVLKGIDFSVRKGEFIAFVGQSGAGKSTIVSLLARYYEPDRGRVLANGTPIDEMDPSDWRDRIAIVRQNPFIFNETLRYNLTVGNRDATQEEIDRACRIAKVDEFLDELSDGFDSQLGDEGVRLSGGQKQRVALARALLTDAEVLILDEATSDLDSNLEQKVQQAVERMDRDYAIITIAHRLSTVKNADRIYTMENGRITEQGEHSELIDHGGKYAELYTIQAKG